MRGSAHRRDLHFYEIGALGIVVGEKLADYEAALAGTSGRLLPTSEATPAGE
jgi:hypothetical protein